MGGSLFRLCLTRSIVRRSASARTCFSSRAILVVSLPRRASVVTGWSPLQMGPLLPMAGKLSSEPGINLDRVEARWFEYEKVAR